MKRIFLLALALALLLVFLPLTGCTPADNGENPTDAADPTGPTAEAKTIMVKVIITGAEGDELLNTEIAFKGDPREFTVFNITDEACAENDVEYILDKDGAFESFGKYTPDFYPDAVWFWDFTVNNEEREDGQGNASVFTVKEGDVINWVFEEL